MREDSTWGVGDQNHLGHGLVESYDDCSGEGKAGTSQGEVLCDRRRHAVEYSFYLVGKGQDHQSLDSMTSCRNGQAEAHASGSHRSHVAEEAQEDSRGGELQVCGSLWRAVVVADSRSTYRAGEDRFGEGRLLPCRVDSPVVVDNPWRVGSYRSRGRRCGDFHDERFLRG